MGSSLQPAHLSVQVHAIQDDRQFIHDFLKPSLPYSLPLLRRCQFHTKQKHLTLDAEICLFTCSTGPDTSGPKVQEPKCSNHESAIRNNHPWLAAHIDLTSTGQTQIWTFASWEADLSKQPNPVEAVQASPQISAYETLFDALFRHIQEQHIAKLSHEPSEQWQRLRAEGKRLSQPFSRSKVLFGTIAQCLWPFLSRHHITREDKTYLKYIVTSEAQGQQDTTRPPLPPGLHFAKIGEQHLQTIIDRTDIPRTLETLRLLPNIGLFDEHDTPVAWGLLGRDGSISSLHTEPEYRRQGLAERVARRLLSEEEAFYGDGQDDIKRSLPIDNVASTIVYSHADVSEDNLASRKVMEKIGGKAMWKVGWVEIDLREA